jgi:hypothetical protein
MRKPKASRIGWAPGDREGPAVSTELIAGKGSLWSR